MTIVSQTTRTDLGFDRFQEGNGSGLAWVLDQLTLYSGYHLLSSGIQPITSPLIGMSAARQWTMSFRNDEQVESSGRDVRPRNRKNQGSFRGAAPE